MGLQCRTGAKVKGQEPSPVLADNWARARLACARQQKTSVEGSLPLNTGSCVQPNEWQAGCSTACAFSGLWGQHSACPHQLLHLTCSVSYDQAQEGRVVCLHCVCVCVCETGRGKMRWHKMSETSRMNISGLPLPTPYPHIHSVSSSTKSAVRSRGMGTPLTAGC